jgi:hypothetical protein
MIDVETLRKLLRYEPETGKLFWLPRPNTTAGNKRFNVRFAGKEALTADNGIGYKNGHILCHKYFAHRVIWAIYTGAWPRETIDHINGNPSDNRIANLREATQAQNVCNKSATKNGTSNFLGVSWNATRGKWRATIWERGRQKSLGSHIREADAALAYDAAAKRIHGKFARLNFKT